MTTLPPPRLPNDPLPPPTEPESFGRLRTGAIALVASTLAIGGIAIGSQFVSASSPSLGTETVDQSDPTVEQPDDTVDDDIGDDAATPTFAFEHCFFGSGTIDAGSFDLDGLDDLGDIDFGDIDFGDIDFGDIDDFFDDMFDGEGDECTSVIPEGLEEEFAAWEEYDKCLSEQLGFDEGFDLPGVGSVTIDIPSEDGFDFSIYDFGEDDGSITIVKDGDNVSVTTQGDVTELDDFSFGDLDPEFEAAHDACADLLPDGFDLEEIVPGGFEIFTEAPAD